MRLAESEMYCFLLSWVICSRVSDLFLLQADNISMLIPILQNALFFTSTPLPYILPESE
jgi:hypothetical protein